MQDRDQQMRALAQRFFDSIEKGDIEAVGSCYAEDAGIWHNDDRLVQGRQDNLKLLGRFAAAFPVRRYLERRVQVTADGFVQEHVLHVTRRDGRQFELPAAIICIVKDGRIVRLNEYLDSAQVAALRS